MKDLSHYKFLAEMFRYPSGNAEFHINKWREIAGMYNPEPAGHLETFISHVQKSTPESREEYFVSTFDVQPLCCLDISYVLFGEDYRRGQFMANLAKEHRTAANDCGTELPDHLPVMLTLLPKLTDQRLAEELVCSVMIPALQEMIADFRSEDNLYKGLLRILLDIMNKDYPSSEFDKFPVRKKEKINR